MLMTMRQAVPGAVLAAVTAVAAAAMMTACEPHPAGPRGANGNSDAATAASDWPYWPTRMRVHPATRVIRDADTGLIVIEARIEFFDMDDQTARGLGQLTLQLFDGAQPPSAFQPIETWNQDLRDLEVNRRQFDDVTRTYLFRLEMSPANLPEKPELRAFFLSADGQQLDAASRLRR